MRNVWQKAIIALLLAGVMVIIGNAIYTASWNWSRSGTVLHVIGLAVGVWCLERWRRFLMWALVAWSLFNVATVSLQTLDRGILIFAMLQAAVIAFLYQRQHRSTIPSSSQLG